MTKSRNWTVSSVVCTVLIGLSGSTFFAFPEAAEAGPSYTRNQRRWMAKLCAGKDASKPSEIDPCMNSKVENACRLLKKQASESQPNKSAREHAILMGEYAQSCLDRFSANPRPSWKDPLGHLDVASKEFTRMMIASLDGYDRSTFASSLKWAAQPFIDKLIKPFVDLSGQCIEDFVMGIVGGPTKILEMAYDLGEGIWDAMDSPECKPLPFQVKLFCGMIVFPRDKIGGAIRCLRALWDRGAKFRDVVKLLVSEGFKAGCKKLGKMAFEAMVTFVTGGAALPSSLAKWAAIIAEGLRQLASLSGTVGGYKKVSHWMKVSAKAIHFGEIVVAIDKAKPVIDVVQKTVEKLVKGVGEECR